MIAYEHYKVPSAASKIAMSILRKVANGEPLGDDDTKNAAMVYHVLNGISVTRRADHQRQNDAEI